jgi:hypothetical protein
MKRRGSSSIVLLTFVLSTLAAAIIYAIYPSDSSAAVLYQQPISTDIIGTNAGTAEQELGTGLTGTAAFLQIYTNNVGVSSRTINPYFSCYTSATYATPCSPNINFSSGNQTVPAGSGKVAIIASGNSTAFNSARYYLLEMNGSSASNLNAYGSSSGTGCHYLCSGGMFYQIADSGGLPPTTATSSRIVSVSPLDGSTTASTAVSISIGYNLTATSSYDQIVVLLHDVTQGFAALPLIVSSSTPGQSQTFATTTILTSGDAYSMTVFLQNSISGATIQNTVAACQANAGAAFCLFTVVSNPLGAALGVNSLNPTAIYSLATSTCNISNISGCFQNAIVFLFYPSPSALTDVANASKAVRSKPPFGYIFVYVAAVQNLNASGTAPVALASDAPITTYIFAPFDTPLGVLFFFFFSVWFMLRLRKVEF